MHGASHAEVFVVVMVSTDLKPRPFRVRDRSRLLSALGAQPAVHIQSHYFAVIGCGEVVPVPSLE